MRKNCTGPVTPLALAGCAAHHAPQTRRASLLLDPDPAGGMCLWVSDLDRPGHELSAGVTTSVAAAATAGLSTVIDQAPHGRVRVFVHDRSHSNVVEKLSRLADGTRITVLATSFRRSDALMRHARAMAPWLLPEPDPWVGTDGSDGAHSSRAGWAWVRADGTYAAGTCSGDSQAAEFLAIRKAVSGLPPCELSRATIVSDCQGSISRWNKRVHPRHTGQARIAWVPGHCGHPLNEASDRLARLARRCNDAGVTFNHQIAADIVAEMLAHIAAAPKAFTDLELWRRKAAERNVA